MAPSLIDLPALDREGRLRCVVETPQGSTNKYRYNPEANCFDLAKVLPAGMHMPFDFGFVPSTLADDGDPLDIAILHDAPLAVGCVLYARLLGAIELRQKQDGHWIRNDRLFAVPLLSRRFDGMASLQTIPKALLKDFEAFFVNYATLTGRTLEVERRVEAPAARELLHQAIDVYRQRKQQRDAP